MDTFQTGSTVLTQTPTKFYWILYGTRSGSLIGKCIATHPFQYIHNTNLNDPNQKWGKINLVNWKEITSEEFSLWAELNPNLGESTDIGEIHQMD